MTPTLAIGQDHRILTPTKVNNPKEIYYGWHEVPGHLMTASKWRWNFNRKPVKPASAIVEWEIDSLWPKQANLYSYDDTRSYQPTERTLAQRWFCGVFQQTSSKERYLWTAGDKWISCSGKLSRHHIRQHINQTDIYGVLGGHRYTRFVAIDLDLHGGDYIVFLRQLEALLGKLWGDGPWFLQVADNNAGGVHLVCVFSRAVETDVAVGRLRGMLRKLDYEHASLAQEAREAGMRSLGDLELFPNLKCGFRLPFAQGRTLLTDRPLDLVTYRSKQVADVTSLWQWCEDRNRLHMSKERVIGYVAGRLKIDGIPKIKTAKTSSDNTLSSSDTEKWKLKGNYRQFLVEFWSGKNNGPDTLNKGLRLLTLMSPYYFPGDPRSAVRTVEQMIDQLPDWSFSSRLSSGDREAVSRVVRYDVEAAYTNPCSKSQTKLRKTFEAWSRRGFNPFDNRTWNASLVQKVPNWQWADDEHEVLESTAALLKCDASVADDMIRRLVRFVATSGREMSANYVKAVMRDLGIKVGSKRENKAKQLIDRMIGLKWIYIRAEAGPGRARAYGIGESMRDKLYIDKTHALVA